MIKFIKKYWQEILLVIFILMAVVLRFYNITRLQFFTYDQARDALFVKRMIVDHEWRLLGTQTSLPGMYLPPFYFYTITPVLWLSGLNPVGIDIYSALIGVLTVPLSFVVANKIFGRPTGVFSAGLFAVSPLAVELTRRAWNPNTLPFFILTTFYFVYRYFKERKTKDFLLSFVFFGYCLSLHFGAWTLFPLFVVIWFFYLLKNKEAKGILFSLAIIFFFVSPLIIFEFRHNFFLFSQAKVFFFDGGHIGAGSGNLLESFFTSLIALFTILISGKIMVGYGAPLEFSGKVNELFSLSQPISVVAQKPFSLSFQWWGTIAFLFILFISGYYLIKKAPKLAAYKLPLILLWAWIFWGIFSSRLYSGKFFFFYYLFMFPAPILLFGFLLKTVGQSRYLKPAVATLFGLLMLFHLRHSTVFTPGWRTISDLKEVAGIIAQNAGDKSFNIATIQKEADRWDRNAVDYRYFTESIGQKRALDWYPSDYQRAEILFVVDETGNTDPIKSNIMEISEFKPKEVIGKWKTRKDIIIYKLSKLR